MPYNEKSKENLQPNIKSREQAQKMGAKGGRISQANRKARQREKEEWEELLNLAMSNGKTEKLKSLTDAKTKNLTISKAMKVKLVTDVLKGNIKAYETIMRYCGAEEEEEENDTNQVTVLNSLINISVMIKYTLALFFTKNGSHLFTTQKIYLI